MYRAREVLRDGFQNILLKLCLKVLSDQHRIVNWPDKKGQPYALSPYLTLLEATTLSPTNQKHNLKAPAT